MQQFTSLTVQQRRLMLVLGGLMAAASLLVLLTSAPVLAQGVNTPTFTPIPTATFGGPTVFVPEQVNVRSGPGTDFEQLGVLVAGQTAPALGRTLSNEWVMIEYVGSPNGIAWVFRPLVQIQAGTIDELPEVTPPATPTLLPTATFEPGFGPGGDPLPTRLPTFTAAPVLPQPSFTEATAPGVIFPPILVIAGLFVLGTLSAVLVIIRRRS